MLAKVQNLCEHSGGADFRISDSEVVQTIVLWVVNKRTGKITPSTYKTFTGCDKIKFKSILRDGTVLFELPSVYFTDAFDSRPIIRDPEENQTCAVLSLEETMRIFPAQFLNLIESFLDNDYNGLKVKAETPEALPGPTTTTAINPAWGAW